MMLLRDGMSRDLRDEIGERRRIASLISIVPPLWSGVQEP
jgi:hypothetical protein